MAGLFICPECGADLSVANDHDDTRCEHCGRSFVWEQGVIDLVCDRGAGTERAYYDAHYSAHDLPARMRPRDVRALARTWTDRDAPWEMQRVWERLGRIEDKTILLLGNGESHAELFMLTGRPRVLIYSDLSPIGLVDLSVQFAGTENLVFAAIDALDLPLRDGSVDVVYGFAFAHHLPNLGRFLMEVSRVLRPGGHAVFMDNAYSPLWQHLKLVWLRPLMRLSHGREPRSPEDMRDTMAGGLREDVLAEYIRATGCDPWFERIAFLYWYWKRASVALFPEFFRWLPRHDLISRSLKAADLKLGRFKWVRRNMIRLIWGLEKPVDDGG
jgi:SAM-dependent methyltransferase